MEHGAPLHETGPRDIQFGSSLQVDFAPRTPVAIRIIDVPAARKQLEVAATTNFRATPARKNLGVEDVAFVAAIAIGRGFEQGDLPQIAGGNVQSAFRGFGKSRDLVGTDGEQVGVAVVETDGVNVSAVAGAGQQAPMAVKTEGIDQIGLRAPNPPRRTVRADHV